MAMINKLLKLVILILLPNLALQSKGEDIKKVKYGKITLEELSMTTYAKDTSADAVVLYSYGEFDQNRLSFTQQIRIKILHQAGKKKASMVFFGKLKRTIKGCTYNLENGRIIKTRLKKESIFEVRTYGSNYNTKIALPNVRVGSVIEIEVTQDGIPSYYYFQQDIPVIYSALFFPPNPYIDIKCKESNTIDFTYKNATTWIAQDLPAFKSQPYMRRENDYKVRVEFELVAILANQIYSNKYFKQNTFNWIDLVFPFKTN